MNSFWVRTTCLALLVSTLAGTGVSHADDPDLARLFDDRGINGAMVISSLDGTTSYVHNTARAAARFTPASTFKIPNTLIALEEGVVNHEKEVIPWDGTDTEFAEWNKDQTLETAFSTSCVWFYQELAARIGNEKYLFHLRKLTYGNEATGPDVTTFWLEGELRISAVEQVNLLRKLHDETLPYSKKNMQLVKRLMIVEDGPQFTIRAKTGWAQRVDPQQGWYVGYVEKRGQVWFFATSIEVLKKGDEAFRKEVTMAGLKAKGIL